ncbi:fimbrillin family protein [uncultured Bacteroides sp.]|uniref:fimbrillin family protein n=1 Tax=uncultured Bacteroides sp. TaxID=162156 RepID=UPI002AAC1F0F|nr:fimbrillin family protein [uncultured Bacteroides sp.]
MKKTILLATLAAAVLASCSNDEKVPVLSSQTQELGVSVNVLSGVGTRALKQGTAFATSDAIGVFITGTGYTSKVAAYTFDGTTWVSPAAAADKINLTNETATVYAFYPSTAVTNPVTLVGDGSDAIDATLAASEASFDGTNQMDYMYGTGAATSGAGTAGDPYVYGAWPFASNAATDGTSPVSYDNKVDLYMHHALSKLSFVVNKAESYGGTGLITAIKIDSKAGTPATPLSGSFTIKVSDGTLTTSAVTVGPISFTDATGVNANDYNATASTTVTAYGLVIPVAVADLTVTATVDGKEMTADLPALPNSATAWAAGNNYTYTLLISGTELEVTTVSIVDWNAVDVNSGAPVDMN